MEYLLSKWITRFLAEVTAICSAWRDMWRNAEHPWRTTLYRILFLLVLGAVGVLLAAQSPLRPPGMLNLWG